MINVVSDLHIKRRLVFKGIEVKKEIESRLHSTNSRTSKLPPTLLNSSKTAALFQVPYEFTRVLASILVRFNIRCTNASLCSVVSVHWLVGWSVGRLVGR